MRRVAATTGAISTVLGVEVAASSGEGRPATAFPVHAPLGLACDAIGNLFVTSTTTIRLVPAGATGIVDGTGDVQTIYGGPPRDTFPASVTTCLTGLAVIDASTLQVVDSCTGCSSSSAACRSIDAVRDLRDQRDSDLARTSRPGGDVRREESGTLWMWAASQHARR